LYCRRDGRLPFQTTPPEAAGGRSTTAIPKDKSPVLAHPEGLARFINLDTLQSLTSHNPHLLFTLLNTTRDENQRDMQSCLPLACQGKWAALAHRLHRLAGAADIIGAHTLAQQCRVLENACKTVTLPVEAEILPRLQTLLTTRRR
jgi:two-component system sensor histidine kinase EvgS